MWTAARTSSTCGMKRCLERRRERHGRVGRGRGARRGRRGPRRPPRRWWPRSRRRNRRCACPRAARAPCRCARPIASTASRSHGHDRAQVDDLGRDVVLVRGLLGRRAGGVHHRAPGDEREVVALARATRATPNGTVYVALGHLVLDAAVEVLVLEVEHRVLVADRLDQQALGVRRRRRADDLEARDVRERRLGVLRVERAAREAAARRAAHDDRDGRRRCASAAWPRS